MEVQLLFGASRPVHVQRAHRDGDGNHRRFLAQSAHDAAMAILTQRPHNFRGVGQLIGLVGRGKHHQHIALAHRHVDRSEIEERVPERQYPFAVVIGNRAKPGHAHVSGNKDPGDRLARPQRSLPIRRRLRSAQGAACPARHCCDAHLLQSGRERVHGFLGKSGKADRRVDRYHRGIVKEIRSGVEAGDLLPRAWSFRVARPRFIEVVDFEHQLDRRDPADRVRRKYAEPKRHRANQFAVNINRTAAHSPGDIGARRAAAHLPDDDVLPGTPHILPRADDFDRNGLGFGTFKDRPADGVHPRLHFGSLENGNWPGFGAFGI